MTLQEMLTEVVEQSERKKDYVADTAETIRMVPMPDFKDGVALVLAKHNATPPLHVAGEPVAIPAVAPLERFEITDHCHAQIAGRLQIPAKYYKRLLADHKDLVIENVNTLFEREPELRMIRTIENKATGLRRARAFLSNSYRRVDNDEILASMLPIITNEFPTKMLNSHVSEERMHLKCLFEGPEHEVEIPSRRGNGGTESVHAGFEMGNSEVGGGSFYIRGFFWAAYCLNGCVWGGADTVSMRQIHVGAKQGIPKDFVLSDETKRKEDELIISAGRDVLRHLSSPEFTQQMGSSLRRLAEGKQALDPHKAVETVCTELGIGETHRKSVLESFIKDQDYSQWGMLNAVTQVANTADSYEEAQTFEELGGKIINLPANRWNHIAQQVAVAA
jgi:hypothetical protein